MRRTAPGVQWRPVIAGGALAALVTIAGVVASTAAGIGPLGAVSVPAGIAAGGFLAGRLARSAGLLQGGMVAVLWIAAEALGDIASPPAVADPVADLALVVLSDIFRISLGAAFGWLGQGRVLRG